jgi:hypothetical protein
METHSPWTVKSRQQAIPGYGAFSRWIEMPLRSPYLVPSAEISEGSYDASVAQKASQKHTTASGSEKCQNKRGNTESSPLFIVQPLLVLVGIEATSLLTNMPYGCILHYRILMEVPYGRFFFTRYCYKTH